VYETPHKQFTNTIKVSQLDSAVENKLITLDNRSTDVSEAD